MIGLEVILERSHIEQFDPHENIQHSVVGTTIYFPSPLIFI